MRTLSALILAALGGAAHAETISVAVMDASAPEELQREVVRSTEQLLGELSGLTVRPLAKVPAQRKGCAADAACLSTTAASTGSDHVVLLALSLSGERLFVDAFLVDVRGRKAVHRQLPEGRPEEPEVSVRALLEALLPGYARKGWGGLTIKLEPKAQLKIDGARYALNPQDPFVALTAGMHEVDVVLPGGAALLQKKQVREGERDVLSVPSAAMLPTGVETSRGRSDALLATSYGLFSVGALAIAGSFIVAGMARRVAGDVTLCGGPGPCSTEPAAMAAKARAENLTRNANILLGSGAVLSTAGAGVFVFDLVRSKESR